MAAKKAAKKARPRKGVRLKNEVLEPAAPRSINDYDAALIDDLFARYLRYNGVASAAFWREVGPEYPWLTEKRLETLVSRYNWQAAVERKLQVAFRAALTTADELTDEIELVRKRLFDLISKDGALDKETVAQHRDYCRLSAEVLKNVKAERDTLAGFKAFYTRFMTWLTDDKCPSRYAAEAVLQVEDYLLKRAAAELVYASDSEAEAPST